MDTKFITFLNKLKTSSNKGLIETIEIGYKGIFEMYNIYANNPSTPIVSPDMITETSEKSGKKKKLKKTKK